MTEPTPPLPTASRDEKRLSSARTARALPSSRLCAFARCLLSPFFSRQDAKTPRLHGASSNALRGIPSVAGRGGIPLQRTCSRTVTTSAPSGPASRAMGHKDVSRTMIDTHVLNKGAHAVRSPVDGQSGGLRSLHNPGELGTEKAAKPLI